MKNLLTTEALHLHRCFFSFPFVKAIEKEFGFKGSKLLLEVLFAVTENGFERAYDKSFREAIAKRNNVSEHLVDMIVHRMVKSGFLDKEKYDSRHVLSIPTENILDSDHLSTGNALPYFFVLPIYSEKTLVSSEETTIFSEEMQQDISLHNDKPKKV